MKNYKSPIRKDLRWRNWAADPEGITGDDLLVCKQYFISCFKEHATAA
jgi:hypothetical protein